MFLFSLFKSLCGSIETKNQKQLFSLMYCMILTIFEPVFI